MGKKKKKKDSYSIAEANIKILKSGKLKVKKGQKISLEPYVKESLNNTVCSRLDAIISKEDVVIDTENCILDANANLSSMKHTVELITKVDSPIVYTITHVINKKEALDIFDFMDDSIVGSLLRSSTLGSIYKQVKKSWEELNEDDKSSFTNVLYVPGIFVFLDSETGKIRKRPFKVNLLLIAEPSVKAMANGVEKVETTDAVKRLVNDTLESAIKCGAKNLVVSPYGHKLYLEDEHDTAYTWHGLTSTQHVIEGLDTIDYAINNDDLYIIFTKSKKSE